MTDTDLILRHIDTTSGLLHKRIDALTAQLTAMNGSVKTALLDAAAARLVADATELKVGKVHENQKSCQKVCEANVAVAKAIERRDGVSIRRRDLWLVLVAIGGLIAVLRFLHILV